MTDWLEETPPITFNRYSFDDITTQSLLTLSKMKMTRRASGLSVTTSAQAQNVIQMISTELPILLKIGNSKEILVSIVNLWSFCIPWEACGLINMKTGWFCFRLKSNNSGLKIQNSDLRHNGIANKAEFERLQNEAYDSKRSSVNHASVTRTTTINSVR